MLWLFTIEIFFEQVDLVVLPDAVASSVSQLRSSHLEAEVNFSQHPLLILRDVEGLGMVEFLGPASDHKSLTSVVGNDTVSVNAVFRHLRDVVKGHSVRVAEDVEFSCIGLGNDRTKVFAFGVFEIHVTTELLSFL